MQLEIFTPDKTIFQGEVVSATFPGSDGSFQVLNNHAAMVSALGTGTLKYKDKEEVETEIQIEGGVVEVLSNTPAVPVNASATWNG